MSLRVTARNKPPGRTQIPGRKRLYLNLDFSGEMGRKEEKCLKSQTLL